jgi:hypothetical protein
MTLESVLKRFSSLGGGGGVLCPVGLSLILSRRFSSFFGAGGGSGACLPVNVSSSFEKSLSVVLCSGITTTGLLPPSASPSLLKSESSFEGGRAATDGSGWVCGLLNIDDLYSRGPRSWGRNGQ